VVAVLGIKTEVAVLEAGTVFSGPQGDMLGWKEPRSLLDRWREGHTGYYQAVRWVSMAFSPPAAAVGVEVAVTTWHLVWQIAYCTDSGAGWRRHSGLAAMLKWQVLRNSHLLRAGRQ